MTQQSTKQQEFDAVAFELEHSKDFQVLQNTYTNYEIDSVEGICNKYIFLDTHILNYL